MSRRRSICIAFPALDIYRATVEEHEAVARLFFAALGSRRLPPQGRRRVHQESTGRGT